MFHKSLLFTIPIPSICVVRTYSYSSINQMAGLEQMPSMLSWAWRPNPSQIARFSIFYSSVQNMPPTPTVSVLAERHVVLLASITLSQSKG